MIQTRSPVNEIKKTNREQVVVEFQVGAALEIAAVLQSLAPNTGSATET